MNTTISNEVPTVPVATGSIGSLRTLELAELSRIAFERRWIILGVALLGLLASIAFSLLMTPLYRAAVLMEYDAAASEVIENASGETRQVSGSAQEAIATQLGLLRSESLARRVAQELNLVSDPEFGGGDGSRKQRLDRASAVLMENTLVDSVPDSTLMRVRYVSPDPQVAARIANALADGFIASTLERRYDSSAYARDFLRNQIATTREALEASERALNSYSQQTGVVRTPDRVVNGVANEGASLAALNLEALNSAVNEARLRRIAAEQAFRNGAGQAGNGSAAASVSALREQRALLQSEYAQRAKLFKSDYPEMVALAARIEALDRSIASTRSEDTGLERSGLRASYLAALASEQQINAQLNRAKAETQREQGNSIQYNILRREVDQNRQIYDALLQRYKEIGVAGGIGRTNVSIVDRAEVPQSPFSPNVPLNGVVGLLIGLTVGVGIAVVAHLVLDNIVTPGDVRTKLNLPVLGVIPQVDAETSVTEALDDRKSEVSEAYYALRTSLQFIGDDGIPPVMLLTSTRPGEGKSTSTYALALNIARNGARVLLIDADLRKPTFVSSRADQLGLANLLKSGGDLESATEGTVEPNLRLLPVGRYTASAAELLSSPRLSQIIADARSRYDYVVIDGPPVLGFADAPLLGALADKTLIVVQAGSARTNNVSEMVRRLRATNTAIAGVILTRVRSGQGYGYDYYSYSYGENTGGKVSSEGTRAIDLSDKVSL